MLLALTAADIALMALNIMSHFDCVQQCEPVGQSSIPEPSKSQTSCITLNKDADWVINTNSIMYKIEGLRNENLYC
jgi:hypothetical protein